MGLGSGDDAEPGEDHSAVRQVGKGFVLRGEPDDLPGIGVPSRGADVDAAGGGDTHEDDHDVRDLRMGPDGGAEQVDKVQLVLVRRQGAQRDAWTRCTFPSISDGRLEARTRAGRRCGADDHDGLLRPMRTDDDRLGASN